MTDYGVYLNAQKVYLNIAKVYLNAQKVYLIVANSRGKCNDIIYITNISYINREGDVFTRCKLVQTYSKRQTKIKTFQLWHKHETPLDDYPVNSLFCFVEDDYAVIDSLAELEKKITWWGNHLNALREEVSPRQQRAKWFEKEYEFQKEQSERR